MSESLTKKHPLPGSLQDKRAHCNTHGQFLAKHIWGDHWSDCPKCADALGELRKIAMEEQRKREQEDRAKAALTRNLRHSGLVGRFKSATFETFESKTKQQADIAAACLEFVEQLDPHGGNSLWVIGAPGTGKTHLGSAMVNYMIRSRGMGACIHGVHEIMAMLRARWGVRSGSVWDDDAIATTDDMLEHLGRVPLLVLDEIGVTKGTDDELKNLYTIIDDRYRNERPTVLLSNLTPPEMKSVIGDRIYDRLRENHKFLVCKWESHRGQVRQKEVL